MSPADKNLRRLFEREARLKRELAMTQSQIATASRSYADRNGFRVIPRIENVKRAVGL